MLDHQYHQVKTVWDVLNHAALHSDGHIFCHCFFFCCCCFLWTSINERRQLIIDVCLKEDNFLLICVCVCVCVQQFNFKMRYRWWMTKRLNVPCHSKLFYHVPPHCLQSWHLFTLKCSLYTVNQDILVSIATINGLVWLFED